MNKSLIRDRSCAVCGKSPIVGYKYCSKRCSQVARGVITGKADERRAKTRQEVEGVGIKICVSCKEEKPVLEFSTQGKGRGRKHICRKCLRDVASTPENKEVNRERQKRLYYTNREKRLRDVKIWKHSNPDKYNSQRKVRRERTVKTSDGTINKRELEMLFKEANRCPYCNIHLDENAKTVDHITPLASGGKHIISNVMICCSRCNTIKNAKSIDEWLALFPRRKEKILKAIDKRRKHQLILL